jgi:hypothetical protein
VDLLVADNLTLTHDLSDVGRRHPQTKRLEGSLIVGDSRAILAGIDAAARYEGDARHGAQDHTQLGCVSHCAA